ncbi:MAG TPA: hypothetical protein VK427_04700, partial [Kofleriaceae bacterium]|nr:hypothetical protein [Kofleriaceae bacterium]
TSGDAAAGDPDATPAPDPALDAGTPTGLTLGAGKISIEGSTINVNMSADLVGKPFSLAPTIRYGVNDKLTIGITHDRGTTRFSPRPLAGAGICLSGDENGCGKVYNNVGIDALFGLAAGKFSAAAHVGYDILSISDPFISGVRLGVLGKYDVNEKIAITFDPFIYIGATERDGMLPNKEQINVPVYLWFAANPQIGAYVASGIAGPLDGFGDAYDVPLGVGLNYAVNAQLGVGVDFWFDNIGGKGSSADARTLGVRAAYAL